MKYIVFIVIISFMMIPVSSFAQAKQQEPRAMNTHNVQKDVETNFHFMVMPQNENGISLMYYLEDNTALQECSIKKMFPAFLDVNESILFMSYDESTNMLVVATNQHSRTYRYDHDVHDFYASLSWQ